MRVSSTPRRIDLSTKASGILDPPSLVELRRTSHPPYSVEYGFAISRRDYARGLQSFRPHKIEGAGKTGCALHPRSHVQDAQSKTHTSIQVQRKHSCLPRAMVLRLIARSPR